MQVTNSLFIKNYIMWRGKQSSLLGVPLDPFHELRYLCVDPRVALSRALIAKGHNAHQNIALGQRSAGIAGARVLLGLVSAQHAVVDRVLVVVRVAAL